MRAPRPFEVVLLVLLVVLAGIYVLGLGLGLQKPAGHTMAELKRWFPEPTPLRLDDFTMPAAAGCTRLAGLGQLTIQPGSTCVLTAAKARPWQRRALVLAWADALHVKVTPAEKDETSVEVNGNTRDVDAEHRADPLRFAVPSAGATIEIACVAPTSSCLVLLRR